MKQPLKKPARGACCPLSQGTAGLKVLQGDQKVDVEEDEVRQNMREEV